MTQSNESFRQKIGLDYLLGGSKAETSQEQNAAQQFIAAALRASGLRVLSQLKKNTPARLYDLVDTLEMDLETLLRVVDYLSNSGFVEVTARDVKGNHEIRITDKGRQVPV